MKSSNNISILSIHYNPASSLVQKLYFSQEGKFQIRVSRFLGSFDCGRIINAKTAASQFRGGIIMGLGLALMEETQFDERTGRVMNPLLAAYHVPVHLDVPEIDVIWSDEADPHTPMGARGVGGDWNYRSGRSIRQRRLQRHRQAGARSTNYVG